MQKRPFANRSRRRASQGACGLKSNGVSVCGRQLASCPARGMWIEMGARGENRRICKSCLARGTWIEMQKRAFANRSKTRRAPQGACGLKCKSWLGCEQIATRRAPQEARWFAAQFIKRLFYFNLCGLKWRRACAAACSVKRHEDWNLVWIKEAQKRVEGRAEWRRLPAELSSCIVGTLSKILIQSVQGGVYHFSWVRSGSRQSYAPIWKRR